MAGFKGSVNLGFNHLAFPTPNLGSGFKGYKLLERWGGSLEACRCLLPPSLSRGRTLAGVGEEAELRERLRSETQKREERLGWGAARCEALRPDRQEPGLGGPVPELPLGQRPPQGPLGPLLQLPTSRAPLSP